MKKVEELVVTVKRETLVWKLFLNYTIGMLAFAFGLGCLGTSNPELYARISISFLGLAVISSRRFPRTIEHLRKKNRAEFENVLLKGIEKHFFSINNLLAEYTVYVLGFVFLIMVACGFFK